MLCQAGLSPHLIMEFYNPIMEDKYKNSFCPGHHKPTCIRYDFYMNHFVGMKVLSVSHLLLSTICPLFPLDKRGHHRTTSD